MELKKNSLKKSSLMIIFTLFLLYSNILCETNITEIVNKSYSLLKDFSVGRTIYFSRNIKCISYTSTQSFCLVNNSLYRTVQNQYYLLTDISDYNESYYYDIGVLPGSFLDCLLYNFTDSNTLKIRVFYIKNDNIDNTFNSIYYNTSMNPLNKYLNCYCIDGYWSSKCLHINKEKELVEITMSSSMGSESVTSSFRTAKISENDFINNNTFIMSSLNDKFKYFFCSNYIPENSLNIYIEKEGNFQFSSNSEVSINDFKKFNFYCENEEKIFFFALFNEVQSEDNTNSADLNISTFIIPNQQENNITGPIIREYNKLYTKGNENIFFVQFGIDLNLQFNEITSIVENTTSQIESSFNDINQMEDTTYLIEALQTETNINITISEAEINNRISELRINNHTSESEINIKISETEILIKTSVDQINISSSEPKIYTSTLEGHQNILDFEYFDNLNYTFEEINQKIYENILIIFIYIIMLYKI